MKAVKSDSERNVNRNDKCVFLQTEEDWEVSTERRKRVSHKRSSSLGNGDNSKEVSDGKHLKIASIKYSLLSLYSDRLDYFVRLFLQLHHIEINIKFLKQINKHLSIFKYFLLTYLLC